MADRHKSAIKRHRQSIKRAARNQSIRSRVRRIVRSLRETIESKDAAAAETQLKTAIVALDKAATKGVFHRNNVSRRISRLSRQVSALRNAA